MSLQIIYGRAGTGKTEKCLNLIKNAVTDGKKVLVLTPEHISLQTEQRIASDLSNTENVEVFGFSRFASYIFSKVGPVLPKFADNSLKTMMIRRILLNDGKKLAVISKNSDNIGFAQMLLETVTTLKSAGVTSDNLRDIANAADNMLTKLKLHDIAYVYDKYQSQFDEKTLNSDDNLSLVCEKIKKFNLFDGWYVVVDGFNGFSKQQYDLIETLLSKAETVTVTCAADTLECDKPTIFFRGCTVADKLFKICADNGYTVLPNICLDKCFKFENATDLMHLEKNLYRYPVNKYDDTPQNISVYEGVDYFSEAEYAAKTIYRLCRDNGYRYGDCAVVCRNIDTYLPLIKKAFGDYDIKVFANEKINALKHPYISQLLAAFDVVINDFAPYSLIKWIKADFHNADADDIYLLENYIIAAGSNGKMWRNSLKYNGGMSDSDFNRVCEVYPKVLKSIIAFADKLKGRKTFRSVTEAFAALLDEKYINEKYKVTDDILLAQSYVYVYNCLVNLLNQINECFGDMPVTAKKYLEILVSGISAVDLGTVPAAKDCVTVSEPDLYKEQKKIVILLGANEGVLPKGYINDGLLSENDKKLMEKCGYEAPDSNVIKHKAENYLIYTMLTAPSEKLYVSYSAFDFDGNILEPSSIIGSITDMFPKLSIFKEKYRKIGTADDVDAVLPTFNRLVAGEFGAGGAALEKWYKENMPRLYDIIVNSKSYSNNPQKLRKDVLEALYGTTPYYSISKIEKYNKCAFSYFLNYGLCAKPRRENNPNSADIGTVMHEVIEKYTLHCKEIGFSTVTKQMCAELAEQYTKDALISCLGETYFESRKGTVNFKKIVNILNGVLWNITAFYKESSYELLGSEIGFGDDGSFPPIEIPLKNGAVAKLTGKIDRVDILKADDRYYINVVDYKSADKTIDYAMTLYGVQIQLPVYIDAICKFITDKESIVTVPAAMLYCKIDYSAVKGERGYSEDKIKQEIQKSLKMKGLVTDIAAVDNAMGTTYCVKPDVTKHQIEIMCKNAYKKISDSVDEILKGNIAISPINANKRSVCEYCDYASVCTFDSKFGNNERRIRKIGKEEYFEYVGKMD